MAKRCDQTVDAFGLVMDSNQIKATYQELGWNQKDIAEYWGMSRTWVNKLVMNANGERTIRDDCAFRGLPKR